MKIFLINFFDNFDSGKTFGLAYGPDFPNPNLVAGFSAKIVFGVNFFIFSDNFLIERVAALISQRNNDGIFHLIGNNGTGKKFTDLMILGIFSHFFDWSTEWF